MFHEIEDSLALLESYLSHRLYEVLRIENGLTYTPDVYYLYYKDRAIFYVISEVSPEDAEHTLLLIRKEIVRIIHGEYDENTLKSIRKGLLLRGAQGLESNSDVSDYYVASIGQLDEYGRFLDEETMIEQVSTAELTAVAKRYLDPKQAIILRETPTLTFNQLYLALGVPVLGVMGWTWHRRSRKPI